MNDSEPTLKKLFQDSSRVLRIPGEELTDSIVSRLQDEAHSGDGDGGGDDGGGAADGGTGHSKSFIGFKKIFGAAVLVLIGTWGFKQLEYKKTETVALPSLQSNSGASSGSNSGSESNSQFKKNAEPTVLSPQEIRSHGQSDLPAQGQPSHTVKKQNLSPQLPTKLFVKRDSGKNALLSWQDSTSNVEEELAVEVMYSDRENEKKELYLKADKVFSSVEKHSYQIDLTEKKNYLFIRLSMVVQGKELTTERVVLNLNSPGKNEEFSNSKTFAKSFTEPEKPSEIPLPEKPIINSIRFFNYPGIVVRLAKSVEATPIESIEIEQCNYSTRICRQVAVRDHSRLNDYIFIISTASQSEVEFAPLYYRVFAINGKGKSEASEVYAFCPWDVNGNRESYDSNDIEIINEGPFYNVYLIGEINPNSLRPGDINGNGITRDAFETSSENVFTGGCTVF